MLRQGMLMSEYSSQISGSDIQVILEYRNIEARDTTFLEKNIRKK